LFSFSFLKGFFFSTFFSTTSNFLGIDGAFPGLFEVNLPLLIFALPGLVPLFAFFNVLLLNFVFLVVGFTFFILNVFFFGTLNSFGILPDLLVSSSTVFPKPVFSPVTLPVEAANAPSPPNPSRASNQGNPPPEPLPSFSTSFLLGNFIPASAYY